MKITILKSLLMLILISVLIVAGLFWFDYLGVVQLKGTFAPIYEHLHLSPQNSKTITSDEKAFVSIDLDMDRYEKRLEALMLEKEALDKRESDLTQKEAQYLQVEQELEERRTSQEERENAFDKAKNRYTDYEESIAQNAQNLVGMPPENAVAILLAMDDQDMIETLRKTEEMAKNAETTSMVAYWLSLMPPERAATIQRKMVNAVKTNE